MLSWIGEAKLSVRHAGAYAGRVRLGKYLVPKHVFLDVAGDAGHPNLHAHFEWRDGYAQTVELTVTASEDGRSVRTADLESLALDSLARQAFQEMATVVVGEGVAAGVDWGDPRHERDRWQLDGLIVEAVAERRTKRRATELEQVAKVYLDHAGRGALTAVSAALDVSERTAARRVAAARDAGLLPAREDN